jgi:hypothetical protein
MSGLQVRPGNHRNAALCNVKDRGNFLLLNREECLTDPAMCTTSGFKRGARLPRFIRQKRYSGNNGASAFFTSSDHWRVSLIRGK